MPQRIEFRTPPSGKRYWLEQHGDDLRVIENPNYVNDFSFVFGLVPFRRKYTHVSSDYTTNGEGIVGVDSSGGTVTVTIATADTKAGAMLIVNAESFTNSITVDTEGSAQIEGSSSILINKSDGMVPMYSDGTDWYTLVPEDHYFSIG